MFNFTELPKTPTATQLVSGARRIAESNASFIPNKDVKEAVTKVTEFQFTVADIFATQFDKMVETSKEYFKLKVAA